MMDTLLKDERIKTINPKRKVVADTDHHGQADVEFQLEVIFNIDGNKHKVKVSCYTTTCNLLVQNMGESPQAKFHLGDRHSSRFFADEFILPIGRNALQTVPNIDDKFIPFLRQEIRKLQELHFKNKNKTIKPLQKVKCVSQSCRSGGNLIASNVEKYGQCVLCDGCEHYNCAKIKDERNISYMDGSETFVCTSCFSKNSKAIVLEKTFDKVKEVDQITLAPEFETFLKKDIYNAKPNMLMHLTYTFKLYI